MSKIAIISQPGQGVVIDVSGCSSAQEAEFHLTSTLQVPSGFWSGMDLDLNFGALDLDRDETSNLLTLARNAGVIPRQVFSDSHKTRQSLSQLSIAVAGNTSPVSARASELSSGVAATVQDDQENVYDTGGVTTAVIVPMSPTDESAKRMVSSGKAAAPNVLYLKQTLRSGQSVNHRGHLVIIGDVHPGAEVMADGDITVWGSLRGVAHAGMSGNVDAEIRALRIEAIQLRIAQSIARAPDQPASQANTVKLGPETARMSGGVIKIMANTPVA